MLTQDQIDGWTEGNAAMDRAEERMEKGIPLHRELTAREIRPFVRAALYWRRVAVNLYNEKMRGDLDAMSLGPVPEKYTTPKND